MAARRLRITKRGVTRRRYTQNATLYESSQKRPSICGPRVVLEINRDDSLISAFTSAVPRCLDFAVVFFILFPRHDSSLLRARGCGAGDEGKLLASPLRHQLDRHSRRDVIYLTRDNLCTRREIRVIIPRDKGVGRGNYELPYSRSQNSPTWHESSNARRVNCVKYYTLLNYAEATPFPFNHAY